jgi:hypothetical protein
MPIVPEKFMPLLFVRRLAMALAALLLAACATSYGPGPLAPGATQADAIARMGQPTGRHALDEGGERLEFARGPMGVHTFMLDFDAGGKLTTIEQVLTEANFMQLEVGMTADEVRKRIGRPGRVTFLGRQQHELWWYAFDTPFCIIFTVSIDRDGKVATFGNISDPRCDGGFLNNR